MRSLTHSLTHTYGPTLGMLLLTLSSLRALYVQFEFSFIRCSVVTDRISFNRLGGIGLCSIVSRVRLLTELHSEASGPNTVRS